jgi:quinol monooxygenase YgiN
VLVVTRYRVEPPDQGAFRAEAVAALRVLSQRPGCLSVTVGRAVDEPSLWTLTTTWASVGDYRRALANYEVKLVAVPLMYRSIAEATAFEALAAWSPDGGLVEAATMLAPDGE